MWPVVERIQDELGAKVNFIFIDVNSAQGGALADQYRIQAVPTFMVFDSSGKESQKFLGTLSEAQLSYEISKLLQN